MGIILDCYKNLAGLTTVFALSATVNAQVPGEYAKVGTLQHSGNWEVGVTFEEGIDSATIGNLSSYSLAGGTIESLRFIPENESVILGTTNLAATGNSLSISGISDSEGNALPQLNLLFDQGGMEWVGIGANELEFREEAVRVGDEGYDLVSGGIELWGFYDEATFVYREVTGNFDAKVRVAYQDASSMWARAGLMVRETLDTGRARPADTTNPAQAFSRYIDVHVNPVLRADGSGANNAHEVNVRYFTGGIGRSPFDEPTENPELSNNAAPAYPNAWLRIRRAGQSFTVYRGTDGATWVEMGTFTFPSTTNFGEPVPPLPPTMYVGMVYSPENGNITSNPALRGPFLAQFRDFSVEESAAPAVLSIAKVGNEVEITWSETGILQRSQTLEPDSWMNIPGAASPYRVVPDDSPSFYRLEQ